MTPVFQRLFTVEEANRYLDRVRPVLEDLVHARSKLDSLLREVRRLHREVHADGVLPRPDLKQRLEARLARLAELESRLQDLGKRLEDDGVVLKDLALGIVDFPAVLDRQPVYLCYRLGEDRVGHWHGVEEGFSGRRSLPLG